MKLRKTPIHVNDESPKENKSSIQCRESFTKTSNNNACLESKSNYQNYSYKVQRKHINNYFYKGRDMLSRNYISLGDCLSNKCTTYRKTSQGNRTNLLNVNPPTIDLTQTLFSTNSSCEGTTTLNTDRINIRRNESRNVYKRRLIKCMKTQIKKSERYKKRKSNPVSFERDLRKRYSLPEPFHCAMIKNSKRNKSYMKK